MYLGKKAQISVELLVIVGILFALFSFSLYIAQQKNDTTNNIEQTIEANQLVKFLGKTINNFDMQPNGAEKYITIKKKFDYNLAIHNNGLHLIIPESNAYYDFPLTTNNIIFNATKYNYISIKKINDQIVIDDAE